MNSKFSRRNFLKLSGTSVAALAAAGLLPNGLLRAQDGTTVSFGGWGAVAEDEGVKAAIQAFIEENPGIAVEWQHTPAAGDYMTALLTNFAAGTAPDTGFVTNDSFETLRQQGILLDITDQIKNDPLLGQENYFLEPHESNRCADGDGRWHGIGSTWVAHHLYYNAALFDEIGVEPPGFQDDQIWDWDTFVEIAKQLTIDANGRHPDDAGFDPDNIQRWAINWEWWWMPIGAAIGSNGGKYITEDGLLGLDSPEAMEAMQRVADLIYVHHVAPRSASMADLGMSTTQMIENGRLAMGADGSWALSWLNPSTVTVPLGTGALPKMKQPAAWMQAHFHSVFATTQHPEEAWQWVRFLATPFYTEQFIKTGLWLPSQTAQLTEEGIARWNTEGIHPTNYVEFSRDYLPKYGFAMRFPPGYIEAASSFIDPAFQAIAAGEPVELVIPAAVQQANDVLLAAQEA